MALRRALPPLCVVAAALLFSAVALRPWQPAQESGFGFDFINWDVLCEFYPHLLFTARAFRSGYLPLWNPEEFCGYPHLASAQPGVLYPLNILFWLWPGVTTLAVIHALHMSVAGLGARLWVLRRGGTEAAALLAATIAAFASPMAYGAYLVPRGTTLAWGGFCLAALEAESGNRRFRELLAAFAMSLLGGYLPYAVFMALTVVMVAAYRSWQVRSARFVLDALRGLGAGTLLCAALLLPAEELIAMSTRARDLPEEQKTADRLRGLDVAYAFTGGVKTPAWFFAGASTLALVALAAASPAARPLLPPVVLALLYMLGRSTPAYELLGRLPILSSLRGLRSSMPLLYLPLPPLAGMGAAALAPLLSRARARRVGALVLLMLAAVAAVAHARAAAIELGTIALLVLMLAPTRLPGPLALLMAARLLAAAMLLPPWLATYQRLLHPDAPAQAEWASIYPSRLATSIGRMKPLAPTTMAVAMAGGQVPIDRAAAHPPSLPVARMFDLMHALPPGPFGTMARPALFATLACPYLVVDARFRSPRFPSAGLRAIDAHLGLLGSALVRNPLALPRAFLARGVLPAKSPAEALSITAALPGIPEVAIIEAKAPERGAERKGAAPAAFHRLAPGRLRVDVPDARGGWLVVLETCYPGWGAWADGASCPIVPAYGAFRAVLVPPGAQRVDMRYLPTSFRVGLFVSLGTLVGILIGGGGGGRAPRLRSF